MAFFSWLIHTAHDEDGAFAEVLFDDYNEVGHPTGLAAEGVKDHHGELGFWLENKNAARGALRTD